MAQAKRSPILGYNHNIKYRGVIFHVQTEDSGLLNPHLFTHLFHEGVIVSTRKLVYDAGSNEDAIKALMQAQHKAVMKDLKKGLFDEKIDQYLGSVPGLEPRAGTAAQAPAQGERAKTEASPPPAEALGASSAPQLEILSDDLSEPIELPIKQRTQSDDRTRPIEMPTATPPAGQQELPVKSRTSTAQRGSRGKTPPLGSRTVGAPSAEQRPPAIDITEDEIASRLRTPRDTSVEPALFGDGVPRAGDSIQPATVPVRARQPDGAVEIYQPAPPSAEPGERVERAGTYSVTRKSGEAPIREKTGPVASISPAATARSDTGGTAVPRTSTPGTAVPRTPTPGAAIPRTPTPAGRPGAAQPIVPRVTAPIANRTSTPANNSGVVMTRPAVIVGAPPKVASQQQPARVRKAREDEGRGFGQGLISEKSLDEVILAYLSEDADDK